MDIEFWNNRWEQGQTGFHQQQVNPYLAWFYGEKGLPEDRRADIRVFVPMCGKSLDMLWLAQNGYAVFGVECSQKAIESFFAENGLGFQSASRDAHTLYRHDGQKAPIEIYHGDFFALAPDDLAGVTDVYDRAALIALPEPMRYDYAKKMAELQRPGVRSLLITLSYDQQKMDGPPFSVDEEHVHALYDENFQVEKLLYKNIIDDEPRFKQQGLEALTETVYKLKRK